MIARAELCKGERNFASEMNVGAARDSPRFEGCEKFPVCFVHGSNDSDNSGDDVTVTVPSNTQNIINFFLPSPPLKNYTKMESSPDKKLTDVCRR